MVGDGSKIQFTKRFSLISLFLAMAVATSGFMLRFSSFGYAKDNQDIGTEQAFCLALAEARQIKGGGEIQFRLAMTANGKDWKFVFSYLPLTPGDDVVIKVNKQSEVKSFFLP